MGGKLSRILPVPPDCDQQSSHHLNNAQIVNHGVMAVGPNNNTDVNYGTRNIEEYYRRARDSLRALIVVDAMHTGKVRPGPLECHPDTRQAIIRDITSWIENKHRERPVLWLVGPAGIGKSAIAMAIAQRLDNMNSMAKVAGSFFFFVGDPYRNNLDYFIPTLAYRLAISIEDVGREIDKAIDQDPGVLQATLEVQWRVLVIEPIRLSSNIPPAVVIIDGLDECGSAADQRRILNLIASCGPNFPLAFFIASRPEPHIAASFKTSTLSQCCRPQIDLAQCKNAREMRLFIGSSFLAIYHRYYHILQPYSNWPSDEIIDIITQRADGQYIYPVTLFKFIDDDGENPQERLQACLEEMPEALSPLDTLYHRILQLSHRPDEYPVQDLLFLACTRFLTGMAKENRWVYNLATLLFQDEPQCRFCLKRLHSVLKIPSSNNKPIIVHHASFSDFLHDHQRSGSYHLEQATQIPRIIEKCLLSLRTKGMEEGSYLKYLLHNWWQLFPHLDKYIPDNLALQLLEFDFHNFAKNICQQKLVSSSLMQDYIRFATACEKGNHFLLTAKFNRNELFGIRLAFQFQEYFEECTSVSDEGAWPQRQYTGDNK